MLACPVNLMTRFDQLCSTMFTVDIEPWQVCGGAAYRGGYGRGEIAVV
jgi:hypothetical protein